MRRLRQLAEPACEGSGGDFVDANSSPLLFIDVDGVLNTLEHSAYACSDAEMEIASDVFYPTGWESAMRENLLVLSRSRLARFAELVRLLDAAIVLSTSWRTDVKVARPALLAAFAEVGLLDRVLGHTPDCQYSSQGVWPIGTRVDEITEYLTNAYDGAECPRWFAIDDMSLADHAPADLSEHFVLTDASLGLTEEVATEIMSRSQACGAPLEKSPLEMAPVAQPPSTVRLVLISDTHGQHRSLVMPSGDVLIHAGDFTRFGRRDDVVDFNAWLGTLPYAHKLCVLGNHEVNAPWVEQAESLLTNATLLSDSTVSIVLASHATLRVHGTAFYWPAEKFFRPPYAAIPSGVDVIISHGPAALHVDGGSGCAFLLEHIERVQPRAVVCGHIHQAHGMCKGKSSPLERTTFVNAANAGGPRKEQAHSRTLGWDPIVLDLTLHDRSCLAAA